MCIFRHYQMHIPVKSGSRIPAGGFRFILQTNSQSIHHPLFQIESIVSIGPIASLLTVDIYTCMAHSSIKNQCCLFTLSKRRSIKIQPIPAYPHKRKPPRTSGMLHCLFLSVLGNGGQLLIIIYTKRSINSPVMRYYYRLPLDVIIVRLNKIGIIFTRKLPSFLKSV